MCDDGYEYAVKLDAPDRFAAHNEWFCSNLAHRAGVQHPAFNPVSHVDGRVWFGSQWIAGEIPDWWNQVVAGAIAFPEVADDWSRIFAFDLFINNTDRHLRNFFVLKDGATHRMYTMDYSRAWFHNGFPPSSLPLRPTCKTILAHRWIRTNLGAAFNIAAALSALDAIDTITTSNVRRIIYDQDENWLTKAEKRALFDWWDTDSKPRTASIRLGLQNGALF
jgi:hypothetical protein